MFCRSILYKVEINKQMILPLHGSTYIPTLTIVVNRDAHTFRSKYLSQLESTKIKWYLKQHRSRPKDRIKKQNEES